jgi:hypothetical protein
MVMNDGCDDDYCNSHDHDSRVLVVMMMVMTMMMTMMMLVMMMLVMMMVMVMTMMFQPDTTTWR